MRLVYNTMLRWRTDASSAHDQQSSCAACKDSPA
ncbi:hypothetical protein [Pseudomonas sp. LTJR-52]|nr:hypothetical protein [Pseudomonas sp. LTJR-52]